MTTKTSTTELTPEERRFIVDTLKQLELRGDHNALRQAIKLIDSILEKLTESQ